MFDFIRMSEVVVEYSVQNENYKFQRYYVNNEDQELSKMKWISNTHHVKEISVLLDKQMILITQPNGKQRMIQGRKWDGIVLE